MKYKMTYPQFLIFHEFIVDLNFFNFIIMPKSGVGVKSNDLSAQEAVDFNYLFHFCRNGSIINLKHSLLEGGSSYGRFYFGRICRNC